MGTPHDTKETTLGVAAARVFWMMAGPLVLAILAYNIAMSGGGWLIGLDVAYLVILALVLAARWLEFRTGRAQTAEGEPLTAPDLRRYMIGALVIGLTVWVGANFIGNVWLAA
jgi:hypothetical protein